VSRLQFPSGEIDSGEVACDPERGRLYVTEATKGGMWELEPNGGQARRHEIGGVGLLPKRRSDGRVVMTRTDSLLVLDPGQRRVLERVPAGLLIIGFDMCPVDGSVAAADASGRLRVFEIDGNGHYRLAWGISLFAPRRAAFSRDCSRIAVTSLDDRHVFIVDAASHRVVKTLNTGPALREVTATGPREFSFADSCSINTYAW
jgi:DNA-binding beta-propeller fold protein YncE